MKVARREKVALTEPTRCEGNLCAQLVREVVEAALGAKWCVGERAKEAATRQRRLRWAADYERAARDLNLSHDLPPRPGDVLFWPYLEKKVAYGHAAVYLGLIDGVPSILENTTAARGRPVNGRGPVRVTPLRDCPPVRTIAAVSVGSLPAQEAAFALALAA
jgi:cell wall-associated NlpC family hydrolase